MNESVIVKEYEFNKPLIQKVDSIFDDCVRDCYNKYYHAFDHICEYDFQLTNIGNNEIVNRTISDESKILYELNNGYTVVRGNGLMFNQLSKLTTKIHSNLSQIKIQHYLKLRKTLMHRLFFKVLFQNHEYIQTQCNIANNLFHFACRKWYLYNNPQ